LLHRQVAGIGPFENAIDVRSGAYGSYSTSSGFPATSVTQPGTYQWTAEYSRDCCNGSMASTCGQEPVIIRAAAGPPVPTLSEWGMLAFVTVLLALGSFMLRRRRA
jgi:hypothetical protein